MSKSRAWNDTMQAGYFRDCLGTNFYKSFISLFLLVKINDYGLAGLRMLCKVQNIVLLCSLIIINRIEQNP